jgi:hypothetical protein
MKEVVGRLFVLSLLLAAAASARADDEAGVKSILDKAIKATGGEEKLAKYKAATWKAKGKINVEGVEIAFTLEAAAQPPKQLRAKSEGEFSGVKFERTQVVNGDKGWISLTGNTQDMPEGDLAAAKEDLYAHWVAMLVPLKDAAFQLAPLPEIKIGDRPAVGVKVSHQGHKDISLYFDKEKGLLLKIQRRVKDLMGQEVDQETFYTDYKEENGILHPMKQKTKRAGNDFLQIELTEFKPAEQLDPNMFAKPG